LRQREAETDKVATDGTSKTATTSLTRSARTVRITRIKSLFAPCPPRLPWRDPSFRALRRSLASCRSLGQDRHGRYG